MPTNVTNTRPSPKPLESEIAFIITHNARDLAEDIAGLTSILEYDLKRRPDLHIKDTYYDTRQGLLRQKKIALRIRRVDGDLLVTMKSNPQRLHGKGVRRTEIEAPWSGLTLARVQKELKFNHSTYTSESWNLSPSKAFDTMGLRVIQERLTKRAVRDVRRHDQARTLPIAELDVDNLTFLENPRVRVFQVEIEAKASNSLKSVHKIAEALNSTYSGYLRDWPYGKLATGMAIRKLLKTGRLQSYLRHNQLEPEAFDLIERTIRSNT